MKKGELQLSFFYSQKQRSHLLPPQSRLQRLGDTGEIRH